MLFSLEVQRELGRDRHTHISGLDETRFNEVANPNTYSRWVEQDETLGN